MERERSLRNNIRFSILSGIESLPRIKGITGIKPMFKPWDLKYMLKPHPPVVIGEIKNKDIFSNKTISVLDMPISMPNTDFRLPIELSQFREVLQVIINYETTINPYIADYYLYLTVDQNLVTKGETHRTGGIHIDGVQGSRYPVKFNPEHSYSVCDTLSTVFYDQIFNLTHIDPDIHHVNQSLEKQALKSAERTLPDYTISLWDSYTAHRADVSDRDQMRTFVRCEWSKKIYDTIGNTHNPLFNYNWTMVPRPIPNTLIYYN